MHFCEKFYKLHFISLLRKLWDSYFAPRNPRPNSPPDCLGSPPALLCCQDLESASLPQGLTACRKSDFCKHAGAARIGAVSLLSIFSARSCMR